MNEQEISKWGPDAIADSIEMMSQHRNSLDEVSILDRAVGLLREYAKEEQRNEDDPIKQLQSVLTGYLDRIFPKPSESSLGVLGPFPPLIQAKFIQPPKAQWIITQDDALNFSAMKYQICLVENDIDGDGAFSVLTFNVGTQITLRGEVRDKFNDLWIKELNERKEQGRIETI